MQPAISHLMSVQGAVKRGFPTNPRPGQSVQYGGKIWVWFPPPVATGLGDDFDGLGFWGAILGPLIGLTGSLFGGKKSKGVSEAEAQAAVDKARLEEQLAAAQRPRGAEALFNKKTLPYWTILILGFVALR